MSVRRRARKAVQERRENRQKVIDGITAMIKELEEKVKELQAEQAAKTPACSAESEEGSHG